MNYFQKVQQAIDYIETNLTEDITLQDVADEIHFSMYHFHRIFKAMVGESITDYIRKRRLTEASIHLITSQKQILDISLEYQYQSQEAFTRAFKKMYGVTPGQYRKRQQHLILLQRKVITKNRLEHLQRRISMEPKIVQNESFYVIGLEYYGANKNGEIPAMWEEFISRIGEIPNQVNSSSTYGVCSPVEEMTDDSEFSYIAGVEVSSIKEIPQGMTGKNVPANQYAVFTHKGSTELLGQTYEYIFGTWLPNSGYEPVLAPDFELYDERFDPSSEDSEMFIYIPIK